MTETATIKGQFVYVGLDIDTTGRRLIDEIVNIAAYTATAQFSQHVMPLMNLNPGARQRHQIRVINVGCFRMLKSMQSYKVIKTKTEIAALLDFLDWLEEINTKDGIIFVYHDQMKFTPYMVIEAMKKYRLLERFEKTVKSFVNGFELAEKEQDAGGLKLLTLSQNYKLRSQKLGLEAKDTEEDFEGDASVRAKLSYEICMLMAHGDEKKEVEAEAMEAIVNEFVLEKARGIAKELEEIAEQEECIKRQSSLREIFRSHFQTSRYHRRRAVTFRRILSEAQHDFESLEKIWAEGQRESIVATVEKLSEVKVEDREDLIEILDAHFDPEKKPVKPVVPRRESNGGGSNGGGSNINQRSGGNINQRSGGNGRRNGRRGRNINKENQGPRNGSGRRSGSRRKSVSDKQQFNNNNMMDPKSGAIRKEQQQHQVHNQNNMVSAN